MKRFRVFGPKTTAPAQESHDYHPGNTIKPSHGRRLLTQESSDLLATLLDRKITRVGTGVTQHRGVIGITLGFDDGTELEFYLRRNGMASGPVRITKK